jgi:hypothetical protein
MGLEEQLNMILASVFTIRSSLIQSQSIFGCSIKWLTMKVYRFRFDLAYFDDIFLTKH